ncbi:MAG: hypothetical protein WC123_06475 [Bacilli bacterium]
MYKYLQNNYIRTNLMNLCSKIIINVQDQLREYFTFSFNIVGSGKSKLIMTDSNGKADLDYNIVIQRCNQEFINDPKNIKNLFMQALNNIAPQYELKKISDSKSVITTYCGKQDGINFSFDIAILIDGNDGFIYKLVADKSDTIRYIWNKVPKSKDFDYKYVYLKQNGYWADIKKIYEIKKNDNPTEKPSFSLLIETINEIIQINHINL